MEPVRYGGISQHNLMYNRINVTSSPIKGLSL